MRAFSKISPDWWDYTTLDRSILDAAARLTLDDLKKLERPGFKINIFQNGSSEEKGFQGAQR